MGGAAKHILDGAFCGLENAGDGSQLNAMVVP